MVGPQSLVVLPSPQYQVIFFTWLLSMREMLLIVAVTLSQATGLLLVNLAPIFSRTFTAPTNFIVSIQPFSSSTSTNKSKLPPRSSFTEKQNVCGNVGLEYSNN